jgi:HSP20 family molecular chaperone IbpA
MKSTLTTSPRPTTQPAVFRLTASGTFVERMRQISAAIANRAYELFEARGSEHGHDWEDWFRAESELLTPIRAQVVDMDGGFTVRAQVPGFTGKDLEVRAEPRRLIIYAKKQETTQQEKGKAVLQGKMSDEMFRVLDLPHEIDPDNITATVKDEVLEVTLPKVNPGKKIAVGVKAA